jgi:hypothetical protein
MLNRRGFGSLVIILIIVAALVVGGVWYYESEQSRSAYQPAQGLSESPMNTSTQVANNMPPAGAKTAASTTQHSHAGAPSLSSLTPSSIAVTSQVTGSVTFMIVGSGFTPTDNTVSLQPVGTNYPPYTVDGATSSDGKSITFTSNDLLAPHPNGGALGMNYTTAKLGKGVYRVSVTNSNGTSNSLNLTGTQPSVSIIAPNGGSFTGGSSVLLQWQGQNLPSDFTGWTAKGSILDTSFKEEVAHTFTAAVDNRIDSSTWDTSSSFNAGPYVFQICLNPPGITTYVGICASGKPFSIVGATSSK